MKQELAEIIVVACEKIGVDACIHNSYSGRGMVGDQTTGVVIDGALNRVLSAVIANADLFIDAGQGSEPIFGEETIRVDDMGKGKIIY